MKAFILAAGLGTRLMPVTERYPKPLLPVWNVPAIAYALCLVREAGIREAICNLHYLPGELERFFGENDNFGMDIRFSREPEILGTGGGIKKCEDMLAGDEVLLLNGDVILDLDVRALVARHREAGSPATIVLYRTDEAMEIGPVAVREGLVLDFKNALGTNLRCDHIYTGAAILSPAIFQYLESSFSSVVYTGYTGLVQNESLAFYEHGGIWADIGNLSDLWRVNVMNYAWSDRFRGRLASLRGFESSRMSPGASVAASCVIENSVVGDGAVIGDGAAVRDSLVLPGARVAPGAVVSGSTVFGERVISCRDLARTIN